MKAYGRPTTTRRGSAAGPWPKAITKTEAEKIRRANQSYRTGRMAAFMDGKWYELTGCSWTTMGEFHQVLKKRRKNPPPEQISLIP